MLLTMFIIVVDNLVGVVFCGNFILQLGGGGGSLCGGGDPLCRICALCRSSLEFRKNWFTITVGENGISYCGKTQRSLSNKCKFSRSHPRDYK